MTNSPAAQEQALIEQLSRREPHQFVIGRGLRLVGFSGESSLPVQATRRCRAGGTHYLAPSTPPLPSAARLQIAIQSHRGARLVTPQPQRLKKFRTIAKILISGSKVRVLLRPHVRYRGCQGEVAVPWRNSQRGNYHRSGPKTSKRLG